MPYRNYIKFILIIIYYILTIPWYCYILIKILYKIFMEMKEYIIEILSLLLLWFIYYLLMAI